MPSFAVLNFGCRANQSDGTALAAELRRRGWSAAEAAAADWVVVNTCTVTAAADAEARHAIRRLVEQRPRGQEPGSDPRIIVAGCYAQRAPGEVATLEGVAAVVGHARQPELAAWLSTGLPKLVTAGRLEPAMLSAPPSGSGFHVTTESAAAQASLRAGTERGRTRATVKVQDGCDRRCGFCVIPMVRGASRSLPLGEVLAEVRALAAAGCQEAVISGINLGQWGRDLDGKLRLADLARAVLEQTEVPRLRLSSVEPMDWDDDLTALLATHAADAANGGAARFARHAHLPLQSGSDAVLRRMHRRYRAQQYAERVAGLDRAVPGAAIGADVMVGFPGETATEFEATRSLIAALPFTYLHIFTYSARQGTEAERRLAAGDWAPVPGEVAAERARELRRLMLAKRRDYLSRRVGERLTALTLRNGRALSDNFLEIEMIGEDPIAANQMLTIEVTALAGDRLRGRIAA